MLLYSMHFYREKLLVALTASFLLVFVTSLPVSGVYYSNFIAHTVCWKLAVHTDTCICLCLIDVTFSIEKRDYRRDTETEGIGICYIPV